MDLIERLRDALNSIDELPTRVRTGYLAPDEYLALYPLPGSSSRNEDWSGNQTKHMNYEVAIRTQDAQKGNDSLWKISNFLEELTDLQSKNNSFQFEKIEQNGLPAISQQDNQGYSVFSLDFFVEVITNSRKQEL